MTLREDFFESKVSFLSSTLQQCKTWSPTSKKPQEKTLKSKNSKPLKNVKAIISFTTSWTWESWPKETPSSKSNSPLTNKDNLLLLFKALNTMITQNKRAKSEWICSRPQDVLPWKVAQAWPLPSSLALTWKDISQWEWWTCLWAVLLQRVFQFWRNKWKNIRWNERKILY